MLKQVWATDNWDHHPSYGSDLHALESLDSQGSIYWGGGGGGRGKLPPQTI